MNEKIACIVSAYNRLEYVKNMIICLLKQTKQIDELIIADDGSREDIKEAISDILPACNFRIKYVRQDDLAFRLARSRNNGVRECDSDFLIFLDQDVIFDEYFIENIYEKRKKKTLLMTRALFSTEQEGARIKEYLKDDFDYEKIYNTISSETIKEAQDKMKKYLKRELLYKLRLSRKKQYILGLFFALYKEDYIAINGFDEKYIGWGDEDNDLYQRFYAYGGVVKPVPLKRYPIHIYHFFDPTKQAQPNKEYYENMKKNLTKENYRPEYGYSNTLGDDKYTVKILK